MRYGLCADIRIVREIEEVGYDYVDGKLNQFALWPQDEFDEVLKTFRLSSVKMERCALLFPKTMTVIGEKYEIGRAHV
mgnify:FL=1